MGLGKQKLTISDAEERSSFTIHVTGDPDDEEDDRLTGELKIGGCWMHVELIPVERDKHGVQFGTTELAESRLQGLSAEFDTGRWETVELSGIQYVVVITSHGE